MKIVLVIDQYTSEADVSRKLGAAVWATRFVAGLRARGHTVTVISTGEPEPGKVCVPSKIFPVIDPLIRAQSMVFGRSDDAAVRAALEGADMVHLELPFRLCMRVREIAQEMGIPYVASFHCQPENISYNIGMKYLPLLVPGLYRWMRDRFFRHVEHIHCPSRFIAGQLKKYRYKSSLHVISNGADEVFRPMDVEKPPEWRDKFVIAMVGRLSPEKRQDLIIRAVKGSKYADRIQLVLPGKGPKAKSYKRLGEKLRNKPVFGFYDKYELAELLNRCDLYVHAAEAEIEAVACAEAFACGLVPVISDSSKSATGQFAIDERSLFKNRSVKDLRRKIEYMIEHPQERAELREQYLKRAQKYKMARCIEQMEHLYDQVIAEKAYREKHAHDSDAHQIHLAQTGNCMIGEDYRFVKRNVFFLIFSFIFKYLIMYPAFYVILKLSLGYASEGRQNLRLLQGGAVSVSNHVHTLDAPMLNFALFPRQPVMTSLKGNFETPGVSFLVSTLGATPIPETPKALRAFMQAMKGELGRGRLVHFYPEAALWPGYAELRPFKNGAFRLAVESGLPVLPLVLKQRPPHGLWKLLKKKPCITVAIGKPVPVPAGGTVKEQVERLRDAVHASMQQMLSGGANADHPTDAECEAAN